jgi:hypothetical protein
MFFIRVQYQIAQTAYLTDVELFGVGCPFRVGSINAHPPHVLIAYPGCAIVVHTGHSDWHEHLPFCS